jgi:tRNA(fMet)-specific endonuclease VapC
MRFCLDTNTCIDAMNGSCPGMARRFQAYVPEDIGVPAMVRAELLLGALGSRSPTRTTEIVEAFLAPYELLPFDRAAAGHYADIRHELERRGLPIGPNDLVIAAVARCRTLTLVTHNRAEFGRVPGLVLEDWADGPA